MGGKIGKNRKKSDGDKPNKFSFLTGPFTDIFRKGSQAVYDQLHTGAGRANFFLDTILGLLILLVFFAQSSIIPIIRIAIAVCNPEALQYIDDSSIMVSIGILVAFFLACLVFMAIVEDAWDKRHPK